MLFFLVYPGSCGASLLNFHVLYTTFLKQMCSLVTHFSNSSVFITYLPISPSVLWIALDIGNLSWYPVAHRSWLLRIRLIYPIWFSAHQQRVKQILLSTFVTKTFPRGQNLSSCLGKASWWIRWGSVFASSFYSLIPKVFYWVLIRWSEVG